MSYYALEFEQFATTQPWPFTRVKNIDALNQLIARQAIDAIQAAGQANQQILIITPVGPLDYTYWARLCNEENVSCEPLVTLNMDEYLDEHGQYIIA